MLQLSATRCSCIAVLWVSVVSFAAITLCVASQRMFVVVYFVIHSVRKLLDTPSYNIAGHWSTPSFLNNCSFRPFVGLRRQVLEANRSLKAIVKFEDLKNLDMYWVYEKFRNNTEEVTEEWRRLHKEERYHLYRTPNVIRVVKLGLTG
jgi:hypothetical protein